MRVKDLAYAPAVDEQSPEDESSANALYPLRFLGMGLLIAWLCCTHIVDIFPGAANDSLLRNMFDVGARFGDVGTFLILAVCAMRIKALSRHRAFSATMITLTTLGTAVVGLFLIPAGAPESVVFGASLVTAIGGAILFCLWAEVYCRMGGMQTIVYGALSCIVAALVSFIIFTMTAPYAIIATSLLPLLSFICVLLGLKIVPVQHAFLQGIRFPVPWKLIALMAFAGLISGLAGSMLPSAEGIGAIHRIQATGLAGMVILGMILLRKDRCDVRFLAKVGLPLSVLALALIPFAYPDWGFVVSFLIKLAYVWFSFFVLLMLANIAYRFEVPSLRLFAIARAASELAMFIGVTARRSIQQTELLSNTTFLYAVSFVGVILVLIGTLIWISEKSVNADWGASGINVDNKVHLPGAREQFIMRREAIASHYDLTNREAEILGLLAQRKSRIEIEQELFLSQNTVKTHVRHLYAKLDIHSKADVYKLFE